jgi:hypothetical protein
MYGETKAGGNILGELPHGPLRVIDALILDKSQDLSGDLMRSARTTFGGQQSDQARPSKIGLCLVEGGSRDAKA